MVIILRILALFFASFIFWKKLRQDYPNEEIFGVTILIMVLSFIGGRFFSYQGSFLGAFIALILFFKAKKGNPWLAADALTLPFLLVIFIFNLSYIFSQFSKFHLLPMVLSFLVAVSYLKMEKVYRSFAWYKSGKVGFLACFSIIAFFGFFLLLEFFLKKVLYWKVVFNLGITLLGGILLYIRSGRNFDQDFKDLIKKFKKYG